MDIPIALTVWLRNSQSDPDGFTILCVVIGLILIVIVGAIKSAAKKNEPDAGLRLEPPDPYRERFHEKAMREASQTTQSNAGVPAHVTLQIEGPRSAIAEDTQFEAIVAQTIPPEAQVKAFYATVAGTSHRNRDRTSRTRIIGQCSTFEPILLVPEPDNEFDPNAIAVCRRETNEQLGYLDRRLAEEVTRDIRRHGARWIAIFRHQNYHPETGRVVGAVLHLVCLSDEFIAQSDAVTRSRVQL
jgi:hypothetical protein